MIKPIKLLPAVVLGIGGAASLPRPALAEAITYTLQATASGNLDSTSFTGATVTLTMMNDTGNITEAAPTYEISGTATVSVSGVNGGAAATFTDNIIVYSAQDAALGSGTVGFADPSVPLDILDDSSAAFAAYDLGFLGPTNGTAAIGGAPEGFLGFQTSEGYFLLTGASSPATFSATVAVPAPAIGRGLPAVLTVASLLFGVKLMERRGHHRARR